MTGAGYTEIASTWLSHSTITESPQSNEGNTTHDQVAKATSANLGQAGSGVLLSGVSILAQLLRGLIQRFWCLLGSQFLRILAGRLNLGANLIFLNSNIDKRDVLQLEAVANHHHP